MEMIKKINDNLKLIQTEKGLTLQSEDGLSLRGDFYDEIRRLNPGILGKELVVKAAKVKGATIEGGLLHDPEDGHALTALDATAGMGEDSLLLAAAGYDVTMYEQDDVVYALLSDTIERAQTLDGLPYSDLLRAAASRMHPVHGDSIAYMQSLDGALSYDVILLDPMFPERAKTGLIKKKMQLMQQLEAPCPEETELLEAAIMAHPRKIIIKRPAKGPCLGGMQPDYAVCGKAIRFDCLINIAEHGQKKGK